MEFKSIVNRKDSEVFSEASENWQTEIISSVKITPKKRHKLLLATCKMAIGALSGTLSVAAVIFTGGMALPVSILLFLFGLILFNKGLISFNRLMNNVKPF